MGGSHRGRSEMPLRSAGLTLSQAAANQTQSLPVICRGGVSVCVGGGVRGPWTWPRSPVKETVGAPEGEDVQRC